MVGNLQNIVAIRSVFAPSESCTKVLERTRRNVLDVLRFGDFPIHELATEMPEVVSALMAPQSSFVTFDFVDGGESAREHAGAVDPNGVDATAARDANVTDVAGLDLARRQHGQLEDTVPKTTFLAADVDFNISALGDGGFLVCLLYGTDIIDDAQASRWMEDFHGVISVLITDPELPVSACFNATHSEGAS